MDVKLIDSNRWLLGTPINVVGVCRQKECTKQTIINCLQEKPQPHLSPLEFMWFCFHLKDIPIRVLWQLVRHRHFSFMFKSSRHSYMDTRYLTGTEDVDILVELTINYQRFLKGEYTQEELSWLQTMAHTTELYLAGNGRVFYEYLQKRLCKKYVLPIHYDFAKLIFEELHKAVPEVYNYSTVIPCHSCKKCADRWEDE